MTDDREHREKRQFLRIPLSAVVRVEGPKGVRFYTSKNISAGGIFLLADHPLPEETRINLEISIPDSSVPIRAAGEVVWIQRQTPSGFAVRFLEISEAASDYLRFLVRRVLGKDLDD